jgi:hypothetical protein
MLKRAGRRWALSLKAQHGADPWEENAMGTFLFFHYNITFFYLLYQPYYRFVMVTFLINVIVFFLFYHCPLILPLNLYTGNFFEELPDLLRMNIKGEVDVDDYLYLTMMQWAKLGNLLTHLPLNIRRYP